MKNLLQPLLILGFTFIVGSNISHIQGQVATQVIVTQDRLLDEVAQATWNYLSSDWATNNHMPWSWRSEYMPGGDYTNPTEIGLYMLSYLSAYEMQQPWSPDWATVENELTAVLDQLRAWQTGSQTSQPNRPNACKSSVFFQWYWISRNPPIVGNDDPGATDQDVPSIDNAFLAASLITIREYAEVHKRNSLGDKADAILQDMNFRLWYNEGTAIFALGDWRDPMGGGPADYLSNENRIINFVARALDDLSPTEFQSSLAALESSGNGYTPGTGDEIWVESVAFDGSYFTYTAPALFICEMATAYGANTITPATEAQIAYASHEGYEAWGLSDVYDVEDGDYKQQGAPPASPAATFEEVPGLVTAHASTLALITPYANEARANLQHLMRQFPDSYDSRFGFRDSVIVDPGSPNYGKVSYRFTALAQEYVFLSLTNLRTGLIWEYFYRDEDVQHAHLEMFGTPALDVPVSCTSRQEVTINETEFSNGLSQSIQTSDQDQINLVLADFVTTLDRTASINLTVRLAGGEVGMVPVTVSVRDGFLVFQLGNAVSLDGNPAWFTTIVNRDLPGLLVDAFDQLLDASYALEMLSIDPYQLHFTIRE